MPANTRVHLLADALKRKGHPEGNAIAIAQSKTGKSYKTGKPPKGKKKKAKKGKKKPEMMMGKGMMKGRGMGMM